MVIKLSTSFQIFLEQGKVSNICTYYMKKKDNIFDSTKIVLLRHLSQDIVNRVKGFAFCTAVVQIGSYPAE